MLDVRKQVVAALKEATDLKVKYELACDTTETLPIITYLECGNEEDKVARDLLGYSNISYYIKLWSNVKSLPTNITNLDKIDEAMRELGFKRISYNELSMNNQICCIGLYRALGREYFS